MSKKLTIIGRVEAHVDKVKLVKTELLKLITPTLKEAGNIQYDLHQDNDNPAIFLFYENWENRPHIHNITYRAVVISGLIHNDDPDAEKMWMPTSSFWTQPAGEGHITAAEGSTNMAYVEIDEGPYLVNPTEEAFDSDEKPINVDASNIVWVEASNIIWSDRSEMPASANEAKVAFLWSNPQNRELNGTLIKLPPGFSGKIRSNGSTFRPVVIQGRSQYQISGETKTLEPGSYFGSEGETVHQVSCKAEEECIIYVRTEGEYEIVPS